MELRDKLISREKSKNGMRGKVNAQCISCIYDGECGIGTWRQQVEACTSTECPLYDVRPTSKGHKDDD